MSTSPRLSVVIPTFRRPAMLEGCVRSVLLAIPADAELIISDDGSGDDTVRLLQRLAASDARLRFVTGPNGGPAIARNRGWRAAGAPLVAFTDDDCLATSGWGEALVKVMADTTLAGAEGKTVPDGDGRGFFVHTIASEGGGYLTCNMVFRRSALEAVGGFDERFPWPHGEDLDLCYRVMDQVGPIGYTADAVVRHAVLPVGLRYYLRRTKYDVSTFRLLARHPHRFNEALRLLPFSGPLRIPPGEAPSFTRVWLYTLDRNLIFALARLRRGPTWSDRLLTPAMLTANMALFLRWLPEARRAHRAATNERESRAQPTPSPS